MPTGIVKFYNQKARFGFIRQDDTGDELYTRRSKLIDEISEGDKVEFDIEPGRKGPQATNVKLIEKAAPADNSGEGEEAAS